MAPSAVTDFQEQLFQPKFGSYYPKGLREKYKELEQQKPFQESEKHDIDWIPDYQKYIARAERRLKAGGLETQLPNGWPSMLENAALNWGGAVVPAEGEYVYSLSETDLIEVHEALQNVNKLENVGDINRVNFVLPQLGEKLTKLAEEVHFGKGFVTIRGVKPHHYTAEENARIFIGISSYIGEKRGRQSDDGAMLAHILNVYKGGSATAAAIHTGVAQPFHNDVICDIIGMYCMDQAAKGGQSRIVSAQNIYNELAQTRPDLIHTLSEPNWPLDTYGCVPAYHERPLLYHEDGKVILNFSRRTLTGSIQSPRTKGIPALTDAQAEALDAVEFLARKYEIEVAVQSGDIRFINNLAILHARSSFEDNDENKRHMVRLWLHNEELAWKLPLQLRIAWERLFGNFEEVNQFWPIAPREILEHAAKASIKRQGSCGHG